MLLKITDGQALDERKLMDVYAESNLENTDFFCPEEPDKEAAVRMVESGFLDFLKNEFFKEPEAICWALEEDGVWVSALRTCKIPAGGGCTEREGVLGICQGGPKESADGPSNRGEHCQYH